MGKNSDKVPALDEFRAPWETESGADAEIDKSKLKRYIHNLVSDKAKAQDARDEAAEKVTAAEADVEKYKKQAADASGEEVQKALTKAESDLAAAKSKLSSLEADIANRDLRAEVLVGLDPKYAKYVTGETKEDLEKSLKQVKEDFGITEKSDDDGDGDEDGDDDGDFTGRITPKSKVKTGLVEDNDSDSKTYDFDKIANDWVS